MKKTYKILIAIVLVLIVIRIILAPVVLHYANKTLANMEGYYGHINDIDLSILRGAYVVKNIFLNKVDSVTDKQTPFFKAQVIDLSVEWEALLKGKIAGELISDSPVLIFTQDTTELKDIEEDTTSFRQLLDDFMPLKINRFEINNGYVQYIDNTSQPRVDLTISNLHVLALNLTNADDSATLLPSTVKLTAAVYEGTMRMSMKLNALADKPTFDMNAEIQDLNLVLMNDFFKAYGNFDLSKGSFSMFSEVAAKQGKFKGYVKPVIKDLDVKGVEDKGDSFLNKVWESVVGATGVIFKNQKKDQVATKVPMEGNFDDPNVRTFTAIWEVLRNAFIQALLPSVDNEINIRSVGKKEKEDKNLIERIFSPGKGKKDGNKKQK